MTAEHIAALLHGAQENLCIAAGRQMIGDFFPDNIMRRRCLRTLAVTDYHEVAVADPGFQQNIRERYLEGGQQCRPLGTGYVPG